VEVGAGGAELVHQSGQTMSALGRHFDTLAKRVTRLQLREKMQRAVRGADMLGRHRGPVWERRQRQVE
jgi:hypothetical protein